MSENAEAPGSPAAEGGWGGGTRPREIEIAWTTPLRDWETEALADRWLFTPAGRWVARSLFATRVRPNQVSFASLVCGALAGIFFATALPALIVPAGLLVALSVVLDAADGELARARKQTSEMGKFFDNVADSVKTGSIVLGLAVGMQVAGTWGPLDVSLGLPMPARIWGLGILTGASLIVQVMTRNAVVTRWRFHGKGQRDSSYARMDLVRAELAEMRARGGYWLERIVIGLLLRFAGQGSAPAPADPAAPDPVYAAALLPYVRAWTFFGGATQFCAIVLASIAGVPLYGIVVVTVVGDAIYVPLWLATRRAHRLVRGARAPRAPRSRTALRARHGCPSQLVARCGGVNPPPPRSVRAEEPAAIGLPLSTHGSPGGRVSATTVAVLLVAGVGSRLRERSGDRPKCLVEVGGRSLLDRAVRALEAHGVRRVVLATGYREDLLREAARRLPVSVTFCPNARYDRTQNAVSLALCAEAVGAEAFFKLDGDLLFDPEVLPRLDSCPAALAVAVDGVAPVDEEAMKVRAGPDRRITAFGKSIALASAAGESIGIERIAASAARPVLDALVRSMNAGNNDLYYEDVYTELLTDGLQATAVEVGDLPWAEIDTPEDLDRAELSFAAPAG